MAKIIIVNEKDEPIGVRERDKPGIDGFRRISGLWLTNSKGEVLLAQRSFNKKLDPGKWGPSVGGTVEEGETYESNIAKETQEEIGLEGLELKKGSKYLFTEGENPRFAQMFMAKIDKPIEEFIIQKDEVEQVKWVSIDDIKTDIQDNPERYTATVSRMIDENKIENSVKMFDN